jgi:hypothetical protein
MDYINNTNNINNTNEVFCFGKNMKKIAIYQTIVLIILILYTWLWYGDFIDTLAFTVSSVLLTALFNFAFEYVYETEWR